VNTELANVNISLPIYPSLKDEEVDYIVESVKEVFLG
jgi:dTDP-4-amino-4,6-dideoxygalactose transaminase